MKTLYSPVYGFQKNPTLVDFPGHVAVLFFTSGCNFRCAFCHNSALIESRKGFPWNDLREICERFKEQWVDGAVITGGEPTTEPELPELIELLKSFGWAVKLDTNGSRPDVLARVLPLVDFVAMDVKCGLDDYPKLCRFAKPEKIRASVELIKEKAAAYEFRTTIIGSYHNDDRMKNIASLVEGAQRYALQPFLPREDMPEVALRSEPRTPPERLACLHEMMRDCADEVVVLGSQGA